SSSGVRRSKRSVACPRLLSSVATQLLRELFLELPLPCAKITQLLGFEVVVMCPFNVISSWSMMISLNIPTLQQIIRFKVREFVGGFESLFILKLSSDLILCSFCDDR